MFPEGRIADFLIIGVIALIVVGPKDLPVLMRKVGRFLAHIRGMAAEFRASFDEMARQSELDELRREVEAMRSGQALHAAAGVGDTSDVNRVFDDIHTSLRGGEATFTPALAGAGPVAGEAAASGEAVMRPLPPTPPPEPEAPAPPAPTVKETPMQDHLAHEPQILS